MLRQPCLRLWVLIALLAAGPAFAAAKDDAPKPRPPAPTPAVRPIPASAAPKISRAPNPVIALPPPMASGAALNAGALASAGLSSGGLRSNMPLIGDPASQCRTVCTHARLTCDAQDSGPDCAPHWAQCVSGCDH